MSTHPAPRTSSLPEAATVPFSAQWLAGGLLVAFVIWYFVGVDQGAVSLFGSDTHIHEWVHDARHFLGFPCH